MSDRIKLGEIPLDAQQTLRKAWCDDKDGHRVIPVYVDYNVTEYIYDDCGRVEKIELYYESEAESTKIEPIANTACALIGKYFIVSTKDDAMHYKVNYKTGVSGGSFNTATTRNICVNILEDDPIQVISKATQLALEADVCFPCDMTISYFSEYIVITNLEKGLATDIADNCTGFTYTILEQGSKVLVESLCFEYDENGNLVKIINSSGKNILNLQIPLKQMVTISGDGNSVGVTQNNELRTILPKSQEELFEKMIDELRQIKLHLSLMTDEDITKKDLDTRDNL